MFNDHKTKHDRMGDKPRSKWFFIILSALVALALLGAMHAEYLYLNY